MRAWIFCIALLIASAATADESTPLFYTREPIGIRHQAASQELPWREEILTFDAEIRNATAFYNQQGWINLSPPPEQSGVLLLFAAPTVAPITPSQNYAPLDILLINKEGRILQIFPKMVLASLEESIYPADPLNAFLLLNGGSCEKFSIQPGDWVEYKAFKKPPPTLTAPVTATPAVVDIKVPSPSGNAAGRPE